MVQPKKSPEKESKKRPPAKTPEAREQQLIAMAVDVAEEQLRKGTASSQVITHFLKLATTKELLEREKLKQENQLLKAKTDAIRDAKKVEELYLNALNAMRSYSGNKRRDDEDDEEDDDS
jgi:hypothetical protein